MADENRKKGAGIKKLRAAAIAIAVLLTAAVVFWAVFSSKYIIVGDSLFKFQKCEKAATELSFANSEMSEFKNVEKLKNLKKLDLRGCDLSEERFDEIFEALPGCTVLWDVPFGGERIDNMSRTITLGDSSIFDNLSYLTKLEYVDASDCTRYNDIKSAQEKYPNVEFTWGVLVDGNEVSGNAESVVLSKNATADDVAVLKYLSNLKYVDATECSLYGDLVELDKAVVSGCDIEWKVNLAGLSISSLDTKADLRGYTVSDVAEVEDALQYLPRLTYLDMCGCGLSNEQMETLLNDYPNVKFVWYISFARWENVRTDIKVFSSLNFDKQSYDQETYAPLLKYCTDLVALDLGHSSVSNLSSFTNLKKLQCLFLTGNWVNDITGIEQLQELQTIELFSNNIKDFSMLNELPNLHDIGIGFNPKEGYNTITDLKSPENIWLTYSFDGYVPQETKDLLEGLYPDARFCYFSGRWSVASGKIWCGLPSVSNFGRMFRNWERVEYVNSYDDYKILPKE